MTTDAIEEFVTRARNVTVSEAAVLLGYKLGRSEHVSGCPRCGGTDRFAINGGKNVFNCRTCGGGRDGIGLMAHVHGLDLKTKSGFMEACSAALNDEPIPEGGERETDEERAARLDRIAQLQEENRRKSDEQAQKQEGFREREVIKARGIYLNAPDGRDMDASGLIEYLHRRTGFVVPEGLFDHIRFDPRHTYWSGSDDFGRPVEIHCGLAMIAAFVSPDGVVTGCHETWIDLSNGPKFRPDLGQDKKGRPLPTKKMRGVKKGSLIPVLGDPAAARWIIGEGIETVIAFAGAEGWRDDTFYCAAGDMGNLAGPADPSSAFNHPHRTRIDSADRVMPVRVRGPKPKPDQTPEDALQVPGHVRELLLLADGDSDFVETAAAMARAETRLSRDGRETLVCWPPEGEDFASTISAAIFQEAAE